MALATVPHAPSKVLAQLRSRAWLVPWLLVAIVVVASILGAQRGSGLARIALPGTTAERAQAARAALRCELRHGFVQRLAITAQLMTHTFLPAAQPGEHAPGATCQIKAP
jgi:hypothetical protein